MKEPLGRGTIFGHRWSGVKLRALSFTFVNRLLPLLLPVDCALCAAPTGRDGGALVCTACRADLPRMPPHCPRCAQPMATGANTANIADNSIRPTRPACGRCQQDPPAAIATIALWRYAYPVDRLIQRYKYGAQLALAQFFANEMVRAIDARGDPATVDMVDLVVPVPLAPLRLRERGFNQSAEVARRVARQIGVDYDARALERSRDTAAQAALELRDRSRNVRGAFSANAAVIGRHIALVDDVMTSGATLEELGQTALRSGALSVRNWVIARAE